MFNCCQTLCLCGYLLYHFIVHTFHTTSPPRIVSFSWLCVWASSHPRAVYFPWRFVCHRLGSSLLTLRTCSSILLFHHQGKLFLFINGCIFYFGMVCSYGSTWSVFVIWSTWLIWIMLIRMTHIDQHDPYWYNPILQEHWIEDSKKIEPEMQEKALGFSWALG